MNPPQERTDDLRRRPSSLRRTPLRRLVRIAITVIVAVPGFLSLLLLLLQAPPIGRWTAQQVLWRVNPWEGTTVSLGATGGNWLTSLALHHLRIERADGTLRLGFDTLEVTYNPVRLLSGEIRITTLRIVSPRVLTGLNAQGTWRLVEPFEADVDTVPAPPSADSSGLTVLAGSIEIADGNFAVMREGPGIPIRVERLAVRADDLKIANGLTIAAARLHALSRTGESPDDTAALSIEGSLALHSIDLQRLVLRSSGSAVTASGTLPLPFALTGSGRPLRLSLKAAPLAYRDLHPFVSAVGPRGEAGVSIEVRQSGEPVEVAADFSFPHGGALHLLGTAVAGKPGPTTIDVAATLNRFSPSALTGEGDSTEGITGDLSIAGAGSSPAAFTGSVSGRVKDSQIAGLDLHEAAFTAAVTHGSAEIHSTATIGTVHAVLKGRIAPFDTLPPYSLTATLATSPTGRDDLIGRLGEMRARIEVAGKGFDPGTAEINATVSADWAGESPLKSMSLAGKFDGGEATLRGVLRSAEGEMSLQASAAIDTPFSYYLHSLRFVDFDAGDLFGEAFASSLSGEVRASGTGSDFATALGTLTVRLLPSRIRHLNLDSAACTLSLGDGAVSVEFKATADGGSAMLSGTARPSDSIPSFSVKRLEFAHVDIGRITGTEAVSSDLTGFLFADASLATEVSGSGSLVLLPSRINRQDITGGSAKLSVSRGALTGSLSMMTPDGGIQADVSGRPLDESPALEISSARFEHLDLGLLTDSGSVSTDLSGMLTARLAGRDLEDARGTATLTIERSMINDERIDRGSVMIARETDTITIAAAGELQDGTIELTGSGVVTSGRIGGSVAGSLRLDDLGRLLGDSSLSPSSLRLSGIATASGAPGEPQSIAGRISATGHIDSLRLDTLECRLSHAGNVAHVDTLVVASNAAVLTGSGILALWDTAGTTESDFTLKGSVTTLAPLSLLAGVDLSGEGTFDVNVSGQARETAVQGRIDLVDGELEAFSAAGFSGTASARFGPGLAMHTLDAVAGLDRALISNLNVTAARVALASQGSRHTFHARAETDPAGSLVLACEIENSPESTSVRIDTLTIGGPDLTWTLEHPAAVSAGKQFRVRDFVLSAHPGRIHVDGLIDPQGEQDFRVDADSLPFGAVTRLLGKPAITGWTSLDLHMTGPASGVSTEGSLRITALVEEQPLVRATGEFDWRDSVLTLTGMLLRPDSQQVTMKAMIPAVLSLSAQRSDGARVLQRASTPLNVSLHTEGFALDAFGPLLDPATARSMSGLLTADVRISGQPDSLYGSGIVTLDSGTVFVPATGVTYSAVRLRASIAGRALQLENASAASGQGAAALSGEIRFDTVGNPSLNLRIQAKEFLAAATPTLKGTVSGDLTATGTLLTPFLSGSMTLGDSYYVLPESFSSGQVESVELTEADYDMLAKRLGFRVRRKDETAEAEGVSPAIDLTVAMRRNTWVRKRSNPTLAVELEGDLTVRRMPGEPLRITGILRPVAGRSYVSQFGRQFEITGGEIQFNGNADDVQLNVDSEYKVPSKSGGGLAEVVLRMKVERRLDRLAFSLTSDPPMEESDILSYLATGSSTSGALATTGSQGSLGASAAIEQVVGAVGGLTEGKVPLDIFQIRQDGARGVTIVAGNYVTPKTYLGIRQPIMFQQGSQDNYYDVGTEFEVEYEAARWLFLNTKGGSDRLLLFLKSRYAY